jgi:hypothetical protein
VVGSSVPVLVKPNAKGYMPGSLTQEKSAGIPRALESEGVDAIEVSAGFVESRRFITRPNIESPEEEAYNLPEARVIRRAPTSHAGGEPGVAGSDGEGALRGRDRLRVSLSTLHRLPRSPQKAPP